jgi:hypothetical protein
MRARPSRDLLLAAAVFVGSLGLYWQTMYPGLVAAADTPRLQLVGQVLGTAHHPGYPLYVVVSRLFSSLPIGSIAFRVNLMSAFFGAAAVALGFGVLRRLGVGRGSSLGVALGLAFGRVYWSQCLLAEVYSLAAVLLYGLILALLSWGETRGARCLYAAAACFALGLGHHHADLLNALPALLLYVLLTDARVLRRPRVMGVTLGIVALGLAQYGFVVLRTVQGAPYLASSASSLGELLTVMRGGAFAHRLFAFDAHTVVFERLPMIGRAVAGELGLLGSLLALVGTPLLLRNKPREALLLLLAAAGNLAFAASYAAPDIEVFLIPAFLLIWPLVGVGLEGVAVWIRGSRFPSAAMLVPAALAAALPATQVLANFDHNDHHRRSFETRYFEALFAFLPARSAIVRENDIVDSMLLYKLLGEGAARGRDIILIPADPRSVEVALERGYEVFGFRGARETLAPHGLPFVPVALSEGPLAERLRRLRPGLLVLLAGSAPEAISEARSALEAIGGGRPQGQGLVYAAIGVSGGESGAVEKVGSDHVELTIEAGKPVGDTGLRAPAELRVRSSRGAGQLLVAGSEALRVEDGIAAVVLNAKGRTAARMTGDASDALAVAFPTGQFHLHHLVTGPSCIALGNSGWVDVSRSAATGRVLGRVDNYRSFDSELVVYVARDRPMAPRLVETVGSGSPALSVRSFTPRERPELRRTLREDGVAAGSSLLLSQHVSRIETRVNDAGDFSAFVVDLGGLPARALARATVDRDNPQRALLCALPAGGQSFLGDFRTTVKLDLGRRGLPFLGTGWGEPAPSGPAVERTVPGGEAELIVPLSRTADLVVRAELRPLTGSDIDESFVEMEVNGQPSRRRRFRHGWHSYEWRVPRSAWRLGSNQLWLRSVPARRLGVRKLHLLLTPGPNPE